MLFFLLWNTLFKDNFFVFLYFCLQFFPARSLRFSIVTDNGICFQFKAVSIPPLENNIGTERILYCPYYGVSNEKICSYHSFLYISINITQKQQVGEISWGLLMVSQATIKPRITIAFAAASQRLWYKPRQLCSASYL